MLNLDVISLILFGGYAAYTWLMREGRFYKRWKMKALTYRDLRDDALDEAGECRNHTAMMAETLNEVISDNADKERTIRTLRREKSDLERNTHYLISKRVADAVTDQRGRAEAEVLERLGVPEGMTIESAEVGERQMTLYMRPLKSVHCTGHSVDGPIFAEKKADHEQIWNDITGNEVKIDYKPGVVLPLPSKPTIMFDRP